MPGSSVAGHGDVATLIQINIDTCNVQLKHAQFVLLLVSN